MVLTDCSICDGTADVTFSRREVWRNERWRLSVSTYRDVFGFCYLEPLRHIRYITELDGEEAKEFGPLLAKITSTLKVVTGSRLVYVYIFGDHIPHLHVHLAPHLDGDFFTEDVVKPGIKFSDETMSEEVVGAFTKHMRNFLISSV